MGKTKLTKMDYLNFFEIYLFGDISDSIYSAIKLAYRDVCRTIHGINKLKDKESVLNSCRAILYEEIEKTTSPKLKNVTQDGYDKWMEFTCGRLTVYGDSINLTVGQAQKWINMTMKYLSMIDFKKIENIYEFCHVPIDNYILKITNYDKFNTAWSRINDYEEYLRFQKWFREKYTGIPLDEEFNLWIKACKLERKKQETLTIRKYVERTFGKNELLEALNNENNYEIVFNYKSIRYTITHRTTLEYRINGSNQKYNYDSFKKLLKNHNMHDGKSLNEIKKLGLESIKNY